jgi:hypothetical protein
MKLVRKKGDDLWRQWDPKQDDCMDADVEVMDVEPCFPRMREAALERTVSHLESCIVWLVISWLLLCLSIAVRLNW